MIVLLKEYLLRKTPVVTGLLLLLANSLWAYSPYSNSELEELEKVFIEQINQSNQVIRNPQAKQYINLLAKKLARQSITPVPYFFIVKSPEINAFAGPGGYIGINSQLILATDNESELAAVMAHEMAHVRLHHLYRMIEHSKQMRAPMLASVLASIALGALNPTLGSGALMASMTGIAQDSINFTRSNEKEADRIGINTLIKAGFNPQGMPAFFKKMQMNSRYYYRDNIPAILRTHPLDEDRIAESENRIGQIQKKAYKDSIDYQFFKEIVRTSSTKDPKQLYDFYQKECPKKNTAIACQYGQAIAYMDANAYQNAQNILVKLKQQVSGNLYVNLAYAESLIGLKEYVTGLSLLQELYDNNPDNYAVVAIYGKSLMAASKADKAVAVLLKGSRQFKNDLSICLDLALAQAGARRKDYAYFTQAQCELIQGRSRQAMQQLKLALTLANNDHLLTERIKAKMGEIKANQT
jgi:predicted Zn-dependent protease